MGDVTRILSRIDQGDASAVEQLWPLVYEQLRHMAAREMAHEKPGHSLQPTALVHEAYLRMMGGEALGPTASRRHFFAAAAQAMRRILVEHARRRHAQVHGGGRAHYALAAGDLISRATPQEVLALDEALTRLAAADAAAAELVQLHVFAGLSVGEAARALEISRATAYRHWKFARAWLRAELRE